MIETHFNGEKPVGLWIMDACMTENSEEVLRRRDALRAELTRLRTAIHELKSHDEEEKALLTRTDATLAERENAVDTGRVEHDALLERYRSLAAEAARLRALLR